MVFSFVRSHYKKYDVEMLSLDHKMQKLIEKNSDERFFFDVHETAENNLD